jgi:histidinol-phosphate aminotransferase
MSWVTGLARPEIVALAPYEHASWEPALTRLHANESPWRPEGDATAAGLNRYPEPQPHALVAALARLYGVAPAAVLVGRGADEGIDLLTRAFCRAGQDAVLICPPTFGMYAVSARIQGAQVVTVPLLPDSFALDVEAVLAQCTPRVKLLFLCSPNNPTGNLLDEEAILTLAGRLAGRAVVVVDEAYLEFADNPAGVARHLTRFPNLAILRTLSKAHGLAGARCGALLADPEVVALLRKIIPPYAITQMTLEAVLPLLSPAGLAATAARVALIVRERARLAAALAALPAVTRVYPSAANFLTVALTDPQSAYQRARTALLLVRDARRYPGLSSCLRVTIGSPEQNNRLLEAWS